MHIVSSMHNIACGSAFLCNQAMDSVIIKTFIDPSCHNIYFFPVQSHSLIPASDDKGPFQTDWTQIRPDLHPTCLILKIFLFFLYFVNLYILKNVFIGDDKKNVQFLSMYRAIPRLRLDVSLNLFRRNIVCMYISKCVKLK